ncbi:MAG: Fe-only nitrogenase accessory AnfO family protein [Syntrophomonas sp.]
MSEEIAVLLDSKGETAALHEAERIVVYQKKCRQWKAARSTDFCLPQDLNMLRMRCQIRDLISFLGGCKTFAASSVGGVAFFELEKAGIKAWEVSGQPSCFLHLIQDEDENENETKTRGEGEEVKIPEVEEIIPGHLRISLLGVQKAANGPTSKQIIQPILNQGRFRTLEVLCDHTPPWLEIKLLTSEINGFIEKNSPGEIKITIFS